MSVDTRIAAAFDSMIGEIVAPPVSLEAIRARLSQPHPARRGAFPYLRVAVAAAALLTIAAVVFPSDSSALIQGIDARYRAALQALGGLAGPPAPSELISSLQSQNVVATLGAARSRVRFTLIPPAGLPRDTIAETIRLAPSGIFSRATGAWSVGAPSVTFSYRRADGRTFELRADHYDPKATLTGRYMFEALDPGSDGHPRIVRHRNVAWRNGDQIMTAVADGISVAEIESIERAMHGVALPQRRPHAPDPGSSSRLYVLP